VAFGQVVARSPKALEELHVVGIEYGVDLDALEIPARLKKEVEEIPPTLLKRQVERPVPLELEPIPAPEQGGDQRVLARLQRDFECGLRSGCPRIGQVSGGTASQTRIDVAGPGHQGEFLSSGSDRLHGEARRPDVLTPADWAGRGPVEAVPLPEDEAAAETPGRLHAEQFRRPPERAGDVGEVIGDLLLRDPDEARGLAGSARPLAEVAKERFTDGDRALCRWALASRRGHAARVLHLGSINRRRSVR
jgi:hypothetical protein